MKPTEVLTAVQDSITVKRVFGDAYEKGGVTVIPVAQVAGGGGAGEGHGEKGDEGEGGGFGLTGRPAGAYVVKGTNVRWVPAVDPNRMITVAGVVAVAYLVTRARVAKARALATAT
ncbi:MAG TPA: spore germination protein GerW family protein [Nocardioidaceae bacterium]|nr:spore germination protein GerW family protein [Nocardioidaceae bacterium]